MQLSLTQSLHYPTFIYNLLRDLQYESTMKILQIRMSVRTEGTVAVLIHVRTLKVDSTAAVTMASFSQRMEKIALVRDTFVTLKMLQ